jgi:hypothetical protein
MSTRKRATAANDEVDTFSRMDGLVDALSHISDPRDNRTLIFAKGENTRHVRHAQLLTRWPLLAEKWAEEVEKTRLSSIDRTPGAASFGR